MGFLIRNQVGDLDIHFFPRFFGDKIYLFISQFSNSHVEPMYLQMKKNEA